MSIHTRCFVIPNHFHSTHFSLIATRKSCVLHTREILRIHDECVRASTYLQVDLVDVVDDLQVSGQEHLQQLHRPALQRLGQHRVVGVGERTLGDVPCLHQEHVA